MLMNPVRSRASSATCTVSRTVSSGNSVADWNVRPNPKPARLLAELPPTSRPSSCTDPVLGTKPPMAFIRVDFPAPLAPMIPTISLGLRAIR